MLIDDWLISLGAVNIAVALDEDESVTVADCPWCCD